MMKIFAIYNINSKAFQRAKRRKLQPLTHLLDLAHVPDERLIPAIQSSGVRVVNGDGMPAGWGDILDIVIAEREQASKKRGK